MTFIKWLTARSKPRRNGAAKVQVEETAARHDAANPYPVIDPGIAAQEVETMLQANSEMLARIKLAYGCDVPTFERFIVQPIRRHAAYINLLPATAANYFNDPGGLFRMSLEIAFFALQATDSQIFEGRATITSRRHLEPRWRLATFIAGLCGELHHTLSQVVVSDAKGEEWPSYLLGLSAWLQARDATRFFLRWKPESQEVRATGVFVLPQIIDKETLEYLATENNVVVPHMMASISGMATYREHNILDDLVRRSTATVIDQNLQANSDRFGKSTLGAHLERYLVDAMRRLIASNPAWQPNSHQARLWYARDGLYVVWPGAMHDVISLLENDHLPGIPRSPDTILDVLIDAGVVQVHSTSRATWQIYPPKGEPLETLKLSSPAILLASMVPPPEPLDLFLKAERANSVRQDSAGAAPRHSADEPLTPPLPRKPGAAASSGAGPQKTRPPAVPGTTPPSDLRLVKSGRAADDRPAPPGTAKGALVAMDDLESPPMGSSDPPAGAQGSLAGFDAPPNPSDAGEVRSPAPGFGDRTDGGSSQGDEHGQGDGPAAADESVHHELIDVFPLFALRAAMGLPAMIEQPLAAIISQMNEPGAAPCRTVPSGLFIPLKELARRKLDTTMLVRALDGADMLVSHPGARAKTQMHEFDGAKVHGIVINPAFVAGLDPADFGAPEPEETNDARP